MLTTTQEEKLVRIAENEQRVYDAGYSRGNDAGYDEGLEIGAEDGYNRAYGEIEHLNAELEQTLYGTDTGGKSQYDEFWDAYQQNGNLTDYRYAFAGKGWTSKLFKPKYDIVPSGANATYIFYSTNISGDLVELLEAQGIELNFANASSFANTFNSAYNITRVGTIGSEIATSFNNCFIYCSALKTIDKIICNSNTTFNSTFNSCPALANIIFEGEIGNNINFADCPLTENSAWSVGNALADLGGWADDINNPKTLNISRTTETNLNYNETDEDGNEWNVLDNFIELCNSKGWILEVAE